MKPKHLLLLTSLFALQATYTATAATVDKADNADDLNSASSWAPALPLPPAVPLSGDIAQWNSTVTEANTVNLGDDLSWTAIRIANPGGDVTINGDNTLTLVGNVPIDMSAATQNLTLNHPVSVGGLIASCNVTSDGTLTVAGPLSLNSGTTNISKEGNGTLVLAGTNTLNKEFRVNGGVLRLDYSTNATDKLADTQNLSLGNGNGSTATLELQGGSYTEQVGTLWVNGAATVTRSSGSSILKTTVWTRGSINGYINLTTGGIVQGTKANDATTGITGAWATVGGRDWAMRDAGNNYVAYTGYTLTSDAGAAATSYNAKHITVDADQTLDGAITPWTLRFNDSTADRTLTLSGDNVMFSGTASHGAGILVGVDVGDHATRITGGTLSVDTAGKDLCINQYNTANILTIESAIAANGASTLSKIGGGKAVLTGANTYTGPTAIGQGTLAIGGAGTLNSGSYAGTIKNFGVFQYSSGATQLLSGVISETGSLIMDGAGGTLALSGTNTYTGTTTVTAGTLIFGKPSSLAAANWSATKLIVEAGATAAFRVGAITGEFTSANINSLKEIGSATGGFRNGSNIGLDTTSGDFTYGTAIADTFGGANSIGLVKLGINKLTLSGNNTYTGNTTITGGTLSVTQSNFADSSTISINHASGAVLDLPNAGTDTVAELVINGEPQPSGIIYDSTNTGGAITGDGKIQVSDSSATPFQTWAAGAAFNLTGLNALAGADPDGDGVKNIAEFALGGNPIDGSRKGASLAKVRDVSGSPALTLTFLTRSGTTFDAGSGPRTAIRDGVTYSVQGGKNLVGWTDTITEIPAITDGMDPAPAGYEYHTFRTAGPVTGTSRDFIRVQIVGQ